MLGENQESGFNRFKAVGDKREGLEAELYRPLSLLVSAKRPKCVKKKWSLIKKGSNFYRRD